jgi:hypothetical protein
MLMITDFGCGLHGRRHLSFVGQEAKLIEDVLHNLPQNGGHPFYLCEHGHTHRVSFNKRQANYDAMVQGASQTGLQRQGLFTEGR